MLKIKDVTMKNFMSVGAQTQAVNFDSGELTLVLGSNLDLGGEGARNGTGKTTMINALSYGLYGEALAGIKRDNLINRTNGKQMMVTVDFEMDGNQYRVERGRKPNVLKLFINSQEHKHDDDDAQGDSRETQREIEKIIGFPHNMFKHLIALNTYTEPFLSMRANDQRDMIEQLLGITDLSAKADVLKTLIKDTRDTIKEEQIRISAVETSNQNIQRSISEIENRSRAWDRGHQEKIQGLADAIQSLDSLDIEAELRAHENNQAHEQNQSDRQSLTKEINSTQASWNRSAARLGELRVNLKDAQDGVCPACRQGVAHLDTHSQYILDLHDKISAEQAHNDELAALLAGMEQALAGLPALEKSDTFYDSVEQAYEHKHNLESLANQLEEKLAEENPYTAQIDTLRSSGLQEISFDLINEKTSLLEHQEFLYKLLTSKDSFIRKRIIDQNISYLNHRLGHYLEKIGLPHEVKFSSDLGVEITEYGRDLDFDNLSRGERNRLILSLSWAFRDIYESLNRPMNLLCIDELIDSGMDTQGVENSLAILKKMNRDQGKNIMLISHKEELVGRVNNVLYVIKEGGFTAYNTDTEYLENT